jgi:hypothetical protein
LLKYLAVAVAEELVLLSLLLRAAEVEVEVVEHTTVGDSLPLI